MFRIIIAINLKGNLFSFRESTTLTKFDLEVDKDVERPLRFLLIPEDTTRYGNKIPEN